jgi:hypothetical protein
MVRGELRLALKGITRWWYAVAGIFVIGGLASPLSVSRLWLIAAWIWPILIWSAMGVREARFRTGQLVFSAAHSLVRQLPAAWMAGVAVSLAAGSGTALRMLFAGDAHGLLRFAVGALFVPTFALAFGIWSQSSKLFEVVYMLLWYAGPASGVHELDFMGVTNSGSLRTAGVFLIVTIILAACAVAGRVRQLRS